MSENLVSVERRDDGVAVITLDRPKVNALNSELLGQLLTVANDLTENPPGAVVLTGGPRVFAAGADIGEFGGPERAREVGGAFRAALDALAAIPRMTIAAVNGVALGGGCELSLACDMRFAASDARFGQPEILLGIIPGGGGTQRLTRLVGASRSKDIIASGRMVDAEEAFRIGLADRICDPASVLDEAITYAAGLAGGAVVAQALSKQAIDDGLDQTLAGGLDIELALFEEVFGTEDSQIGVKSFLEHGPGKADFTGR
ncbi:MAG: enoyl-CoA hydratase/isomerase family protein [Actinomycetia bacterium]|nr:enoyl-CoA hydratase/isomerase family protein [Actinomycetes bacterium]MCP4959448.1 enoyl-CoA hydratase/isomerase family protein [Actinomycetes bacterium]